MPRGNDPVSQTAFFKKLKFHKSVTQYHKCKIEDTRFVNHDTVLMRAKKLNNIYMPIPLGHHVSMRIRKGGYYFSLNFLLDYKVSEHFK